MRLRRLRTLLPEWKNVLLALLSAVLLTLAFPDFELWYLAWVALAPLMWAVHRESASSARSFVLGWLFGTAFFFWTCWWLTYAPITYAGFPALLAYFLLLVVCAAAGVFPAIFAGILAFLIRRFGTRAFLAAPFVWVFTEFLRYWITGNDWNALGYSQFTGSLAGWASIGGVLSVSFAVFVYHLGTVGLILTGVDIAKALRKKASGTVEPKEVECSKEEPEMFKPLNDGSDDDLNPFMMIGALVVFVLFAWLTTSNHDFQDRQYANVIAVQPNVPLSGLTQSRWEELRQHQFDLAEAEIKKINEQPTTNDHRPTLVILPESPMNFMYDEDAEFRQYVSDFTTGNNVSLLFNSAEPDKTNGKYFNSAVMISPDGKMAAQYDKIYLLPFGEAVPVPFEGILPGFVGNFSYGREYDLLPVGDAKAGVMICFESHFGQLAREYVKDGADVLIEMTNDGYLGPTPVLKQHLANAVFRAVETDRPVIRVTNVGITAYIDRFGEISGELPPYTEGSRVWEVSTSDGSQTFYVRYGDWFAWLCSIVTVGLLIIGMSRRKRVSTASE